MGVWGLRAPRGSTPAPRPKPVEYSYKLVLIVELLHFFN
jgi:hypothetical protein